MKKKVVVFIAVTVIAISSWYISDQTSEVTISSIILDNVEALANQKPRCTGPKSSGECESRNAFMCGDNTGC